MKKLFILIQALRLYSLPVSLLPIFLVWAMLVFYGFDVSSLKILLLFLGVFALHSATNLANDYYDYKYKIDSKDSLGSSGVLTSNLLSAKSIRIYFVFCYLLAVFVGIYFINLRGHSIVIIILIAFLGSFFYTAGKYAFKYIALGELVVFILIGPLLFIAINLALTGTLLKQVVFVSLPVGLLGIAILTANNYRDLKTDQASKIKTLAILLGPMFTQNLLILEILLPYFLLSFLVNLGILPFFSALSFFAMPWAFKLLGTLLNAEDALPLNYTENIAKLYFLFVSLLILSLLFAKIYLK